MFSLQRDNGGYVVEMLSFHAHSATIIAIRMEVIMTNILSIARPTD